MTSVHDVAVVGLGPVGATLTALLAQRGVRVLVVEQSADVFALPRAAHIDHMGLRTLQELGLLDELLPGMIPNPGLEFRSADGETLMRIPGDQGSVSGLPASMYFHQPTLDGTLRRHALSLPGVTARVPATLESFGQDQDGVTLRLRHPDGTETRERASWLIGADGSWSPVREGAGLTLEDLGFDERWLVVDLQLPRPMPHLPTQAVHMCDPRRPHTAIPMPDLRYRFELQLNEEDDPAEAVRPERVAELLSGWLDVDDVEVVRAATYVFHGLVARRWRAGRVLIAGDAAHQMPPFLGQGMCSGMRDAVNLAWKLARVVRARMDLAEAEPVLDTYESERKPHVRAITEAVIAFGGVICSRDPEYAAERDRRLLADPRPLEKRIPFSLPRLQPGPLVAEGGGRLFGQPPVRGRGLDDTVGDRFLLIARDRRDVDPWWCVQDDVLTVVTEPGAGDELRRFAARTLESRGVRVVLVRPDRYVLYAGDDVDHVREAYSLLRGREGVLS